jgi:long-chain fatty acid transport protein
MRRETLLRGLGLCLLLPQSAWASGFSVARFASEQGHPTTSNATAVYFNPAALTLSDGAHLFADMSVAVRRVTYDRRRAPTDAPDPLDASGANVGHAELRNVLFNPALAASFTVAGFSFGVGLFAPFGGSVSWDRRPEFAASRYPGIVDGVTRFQSIEGQISTRELSLGAAHRVLGGLSLGLALNLMRSSVDDVRAYSNGGNDVTKEGRSLLEVSGNAIGFGAGALYEAVPRALWFGLSYQSRPNVTGGMRLHGSLENDLGGPSSANVDLVYDLPDIVRWGVRYRQSERLELRAFGDYTRFSAFRNQCVVQHGSPCALSANGGESPGGQVLQNVPRHFRDSLGVRLGASVWPRSACEFFSGMGFDSSAVPDATFDPGLPDWAGASFALGGRFALSSNVHAAISYTHFVYLPRNVHSGLAQLSPPSQSPDASGHYAQQLGVGNVNLELGF